MANKLYSTAFFSKLILFIDNSENVIEKCDKLKFSICHGSMISHGIKNFCEKFLGSLWKILTCQKSICDKLYLDQPWIPVCPLPTINFHYIFPRRSLPIMNI